jgi:hypothetical protein
MTAITPNTELCAVNDDFRRQRRADVCALDATLDVSQVQSLKRFCKLIVAIAPLSVAGVASSH